MAIINDIKFMKRYIIEGRELTYIINVKNVKRAEVIYMYGYMYIYTYL